MSSATRLGPSNGLVNGRSPVLGDLLARSARMEAFTKLKPTCVALMAIASTTPTSHTRHAPLIDTLHSVLSSLDPTLLDPGMINYILFPLTTVIRQHNPSELPDNFLESTFRLLAVVVDAWKKRDGGMELAAWEQLWRFVVASVGPRVGENGRGIGKGKGKAKEAGQKVQLQSVHLLAALLEPETPSPSPTSHPTAEMLQKVSTVKSPLLPTLFQTITLLLDLTTPSPPYLRLQLASLRLLRPLITLYLAKKHNVLAAILPGTVSAMSKLVHAEGKGIKGESAQLALGVVEDVVVATLKDEDLRELGVLRPIVDDLTQLAEEWEKTNDPVGTDESPPPSPASTSTSTTTPFDPFPPLSQSYLAFTSQQLFAAIPPILTAASSHPSDLARTASASLGASLVDRCHDSLPLLVPRALSILLLLGKDPFDPVRNDARSHLRHLMGRDDLQIEPVILDILSNAVNSLPRLVTSQQEDKVAEHARLITAIAETAIDLESLVASDRKRRNPISDLLGPSGAVERWSWALLDCIEFGRPAGWTAAGSSAARAAERGWQTGSITSGIPLLLEDGDVITDGGGPSGNFPHLPLRYIESEGIARGLGEMLSALGAAGGGSALHSVEHFVRFAKAQRKRQISKAVSALWVAQRLLDGIATSQLEGAEGKVGKTTRKMARDLVKAVVAMDDDDDDDDEYEVDDPNYPGADESNADALIPVVERGKGLNALTTLLDKRPNSSSYTAAETRRLHAQAQRTLLTALSLQSLALSARVLSSSFRPLLLNTLYILLSHLASPQDIISEFASLSLSQVAYHTGYATPQNLVMDNVDYVINVVSQRLTYHRLSSTAPLVLIAMIRLVGAPIVPLVHDVVDEIFDALDDYHGYETLASSLLAVLVTLVEVMASEVRAEGLSEERKKKLEDMSRIDQPPEPSGDFEKFFLWWNEREERSKEQIQEVLERAPQHAWGKANLPAGPTQTEEEDDEAAPPPDDAEAEPPATRSQAVATRILSQATYFLTHSSPFLRSKILSLIAHAIPVLAAGNRESDFLPLIDGCWHTVLNRLDPSTEKEVYVRVEAAEVLVSLCEGAGDFMSKRVLEHVWPKFRILLEEQKKKDSHSALATRTARHGNPTASATASAFGTESVHTTSHRLHRAILRTAAYIAEQVPVADDLLWEMMVTLRVFLDRRVNGELQGLAVGLYEKLGRRDADALWVVLNATAMVGGVVREGTDEESVCGVVGLGQWKYLGEEGLDIEHCARALLAHI